MESGPSIFAGMVFSLFEAALPEWTTVRVRRRGPVVPEAGRTASAAVAAAVALPAPAPARGASHGAAHPCENRRITAFSVTDGSPSVQA